MTLGFHPLSNDTHAQGVGQFDHHPGEGCFIGTNQNVGHKALVNFEFIKLQSFEPSQ